MNGVLKADHIPLWFCVRKLTCHPQKLCVFPLRSKFTWTRCYLPERWLFLRPILRVKIGIFKCPADIFKFFSRISYHIIPYIILSHTSAVLAEGFPLSSTQFSKFSSSTEFYPWGKVCTWLPPIALHTNHALNLSLRRRPKHRRFSNVLIIDPIILTVSGGWCNSKFARNL